MEADGFGLGGLNERLGQDVLPCVLLHVVKCRRHRPGIGQGPQASRWLTIWGRPAARLSRLSLTPISCSRLEKVASCATNSVSLSGSMGFCPRIWAASSERKLSDEKMSPDWSLTAGVGAVGAGAAQAPKRPAGTRWSKNWRASAPATSTRSG